MRSVKKERSGQGDLEDKQELRWKRKCMSLLIFIVEIQRHLHHFLWRWSPPRSVANEKPLFVRAVAQLRICQAARERGDSKPVSPEN